MTDQHTGPDTPTPDGDGQDDGEQVHCSECRALLTAPLSRLAGIGPVCILGETPKPGRIPAGQLAFPEPGEDAPC